MRRSILSAGALVAAAMGAGLSQSAEVVPRPAGLGAWIGNNNRHMFAKGRKPQPARRARFQRATGPGSLNERNEMFALIEAGKPQEAAEYYRRCLNINYRAGKPQLHRDMVTWYAYYN